MATKVLLVDDERDIVELVRYNLEKEGFQVAHAADGAAAFRLVREHPDLVILDLMLPGLDGLEICRRLRRDPALPAAGGSSGRSGWPFTCRRSRGR